jgi:hypothetical protein
MMSWRVDAFSHGNCHVVKEVVSIVTEQTRALVRKAQGDSDAAGRKFAQEMAADGHIELS